MSTKDKRRGGEEGFTLIEVLVAVVLLSVGFLSASSMQTTAISANKFAKDATLAIQLAEEMADRVRANGGNTPNIYNGMDTDNICSGINPSLGDCLQWQARLKNSQYGLIDARGQIEVSLDTPVAYTATLTVKVSWGSNWGVKSRQVVLKTIIETWVS